MRASLTVILLLVSLVLGDALQEAQPCDVEKCQLPNCKCSTTDSGSGLAVDKIPQMVLLTFDDAVTRQTYNLFAEALFNRTNPDGCPVAATHFVSHEYTDYQRVHNLWTRGHEIALHSVTHMTNQDYWKNLSLTTMEAEFGGLRTILGQFAAIPESDIHGIRMPFLQFGGNVTPEGLQSLGLLYDSSMPTQWYVDPALWPYTFDYASTQECNVPPCANASFPGIWEVPMISWQDQRGISCSMVDACVYVPETAEPLLEWIIGQFNRHYLGSRAPFSAFMHAAWFLRNPANFEAYKGFIDHLQSLPDVYIVSLNQAIQWIKNPLPLSAEKPFGECETRVPPRQCILSTCQLTSPSGEERWMTSCATTCPTNYPWIGNPTGA